MFRFHRSHSGGTSLQRGGSTKRSRPLIKRDRHVDYHRLRLEWLEPRTLLSAYYPSLAGDVGGIAVPAVTPQILHGITLNLGVSTSNVADTTHTSASGPYGTTFYLTVSSNAADLGYPQFWEVHTALVYLDAYAIDARLSYGMGMGSPWGPVTDSAGYAWPGYSHGLCQLGSIRGIRRARKHQLGDVDRHPTSGHAHGAERRGDRIAFDLGRLELIERGHRLHLATGDLRQRNLYPGL